MLALDFGCLRVFLASLSKHNITSYIHSLCPCIFMPGKHLILCDILSIYMYSASINVPSKYRLK